jgi:hypothetical protein
MDKYYFLINSVRHASARQWANVMATPAAQAAKRGARVVFYPLIVVGSGYSTMAAQAPFTTGFVTTGLKTTAADAFAQLVVEKREKIDWRRNAMFTAFGFCYLGGFQYWLYNVQFTKWCGFITKHSGHLGSAPVKTFIDQFIHHPTMYFPVFYSLKATVEGRPLVTGPDSALARYRDEYFDCWKALWSIWVPCTLFNFTFVPRHLRIPFVAATSAVWTVTLSVMQGAFSEEKAAPKQPPALVRRKTFAVAQGGPVDGIVEVVSPGSQHQAAAAAGGLTGGLTGSMTASSVMEMGYSSSSGALCDSARTEPRVSESSETA